MRNLTMPNVHVETRLLESEYELLKEFKEKNGLKTDYQGLKELVKALDIPEFHEEIKTEETLSSENVKTEVKPIDRTNLENWVKDLSFEQQPKKTKRFKINNHEAGVFEVYLDWTTPNEIGLYVSNDEMDKQDKQFVSIIDLKTGKITT